MIGQTEIVEKDQVNYWSFDKGKIKGKTIQDSFGTTDGVIQGKIASKKGKNGEALEFDGDKSNFVTFPGDVDFSKDFTWMCWIKTEENGVLFCKTGPAGSDAQGAKTWWISDKVLSFDVGWVGNFKDQKGQVADGKWHHVAVTAEGKNGTLQHYVDGEPTGKGTLGLNEKPEKDIKDVRLNLGQDGCCDGEFGYFTGLIDEFAVYTRLLSDAEVQQKLILIEAWQLSPSINYRQFGVI